MYTLRKRIRRFIITVYHALSIDKVRMFLGGFDKQIDSAINKYGSESLLSKKDLKTDIKRSYYRYLTTPDEYFLFGFEGEKENYRRSFLSDNLRVRYLLKTVSEKKYDEELSDKHNFYKIASKYFNREVIKIGPSETITFAEFSLFVTQHQNLFVKPVSSTFGRGAHILRIKKGTETVELNKLYQKYRESFWIMEELIIQSPLMSQWNNSSVNTVRLPCILNNGKFNILNPFFRTGRKGKVVDNAGGGGVFACVDEKTGIVITDGFDELNVYHSIHPDSGIVFKGWQIPDWEELIKLAELIFRTCFPDHKYIGFDFALTNDGWVLIEGNWGQFVGQYVSKQGIRDKFVHYINN